jgi:hypothetical protein
MLFVQIMGRGLRTATGKDHCIARGSLVLTDQGEIPIEDITLEHKVWDGVSFVEHGGAVCRGVQPTISYDGIRATTDHLVMTDEGWETIEEAAYRCLRLACTGIAGKPIRFSDHHIKENRGKNLQVASGSRVSALQGTPYGSIPQYQEASRYKGLSVLQWASTGSGATLALSQVPATTEPLHQFMRSAISFLRWAWDRISFSIDQRRSTMGSRQTWYSREKMDIGQNRQQWSLRAGEFALGKCSCADEQHVTCRWQLSTSVYKFQNVVSGNKICGSLFEKNDVRDDRCGDHREVGHAFMQTEREVWDIYNAGPLQRYTANGKLVHNCLVLDHTSTHSKLGFVTDIDQNHDQLYAEEDKVTTVTERIRLPKECPACGFLKGPGIAKCPMCQHVAVAHSKIEPTPGELKELDRKRKEEEDVGDKAQFFAELRAFANERGYNPHWADNKFREKFGVWPNHYKWVAPASEISPKTRSWIKGMQIRWIKGRAKGNYPQVR